MKRMLKYIIAFVIGLGMAFGFCLVQNVFKQDTTQDTFKVLTNAFFVSGILMLCFGLLCFSSNQGAFTMLTYGTRKFFSMFKRRLDRNVEDTYLNYKMSKLEKQTPFIHLVLVGAVLICISLLFLIGYYKN